MEIKVSKSDVIWSYAAQFFNLATGLITLPLILKMLSAEEVGLNYILISLASIITLFDMGFSGQFARFITYIFSGAQELQKDGMSTNKSDVVNQHLLATTILTAKKIYKFIAFIAFVTLVSLGTIYVWHVTNGFSSIDNIIVIWCISCLASYFNIYYLYLNSFLQGRGMIKQTKQAQVYSRVFQVLLTFILLLCGFGLLGVVIANLLAPFVLRYFSYNAFFDSYIKDVISNNKVTNSEMKEIFQILFYNAKKMGVIGILSSIIGYASTIVIGGFLTLKDVGSYGLMMQLIGIVVTLSSTYFYSLTPKLGSLIVLDKKEQFRKNVGLSLFSFYILYAIGIFFLMLAPVVFKYFEFHTQLPGYGILIAYSFYKLLEQNQSIYSQLLLITNDLVFYPSAVVTGIVSFALLIIMLYVGCGLWGVVFSQAIPLFAYAAWKWPIYSRRKFELSIKNDILISTYKIIYNIIWKKFLKK